MAKDQDVEVLKEEIRILKEEVEKLKKVQPITYVYNYYYQTPFYPYPNYPNYPYPYYPQPYTISYTTYTSSNPAALTSTVAGGLNLTGTCTGTDTKTTC